VVFLYPFLSCTGTTGRENEISFQFLEKGMEQEILKQVGLR
jgi:hypothetical protein